MAFSSFNSVHSLVNYKKGNTPYVQTTAPTTYNAVPAGLFSNSTQFTDANVNDSNPLPYTYTASITVNTTNRPYTNVAKMQGNYYVKASSVASCPISQAFRNKKTSGAWSSYYSGTSTNYLNGVWRVGYGGFIHQTKISGTMYNGEWIQIMLPNAFIVKSFDMTSGSLWRFPNNFKLVGTNDSTIVYNSNGDYDSGFDSISSPVQWTAIYSSTNFVNAADTTYTFSTSTNTTAYKIYRLCIGTIGGSVGGSTAGNQIAEIRSLQLYGTYSPAN